MTKGKRELTTAEVEIIQSFSLLSTSLDLENSTLAPIEGRQGYSISFKVTNTDDIESFKKQVQGLSVEGSILEFEEATFPNALVLKIYTTLEVDDFARNLDASLPFVVEFAPKESEERDALYNEMLLLDQVYEKSKRVDPRYNSEELTTNKENMSTNITHSSAEVILPGHKDPVIPSQVIGYRMSLAGLRYEPTNESDIAFQKKAMELERRMNERIEADRKAKEAIIERRRVLENNSGEQPCHNEEKTRVLVNKLGQKSQSGIADVGQNMPRANPGGPVKSHIASHKPTAISTSPKGKENTPLEAMQGDLEHYNKLLKEFGRDVRKVEKKWEEWEETRRNLEGGGVRSVLTEHKEQKHALQAKPISQSRGL